MKFRFKTQQYQTEAVEHGMSRYMENDDDEGWD